jgi:O-acetyl-ADP-ribose deacetylase (regulator of RNase III)
MIRYLESSLFDSPAQTLVNTVNTVGVMGKGIAKEFKERYPEMFREYSRICRRGDLSIGSLHLWRSNRQWVLNFPTKTTWKKPSSLEYVRLGLEKFVATYKDLGIVSASFPPLGCGNGGLNWQDVRPIMESHLHRLTIPVYIHNVHVPESYVPEHVASPPERFSHFLVDLETAIAASNGVFLTSSETPYRVAFTHNPKSLVISHSSGKKEVVELPALEETWVRLRDHILSIEVFPDERSKRLKSYLYPILRELPYVRSVKVRSAENSLGSTQGLFFEKGARATRELDAQEKIETQGCLFQ